MEYRVGKNRKAVIAVNPQESVRAENTKATSPTSCLSV